MCGGSENVSSVVLAMITVFSFSVRSINLAWLCAICVTILSSMEIVDSLPSHKAHLRKVIVQLTTPRISGASDPDKEDGLYGLSAVYSGQQHEPQRNQRSIVHLLDRVANFEVMLVASIAEKHLSFSISGMK